jgi:hypothetical protein
MATRDSRGEEILGARIRNKTGDQESKELFPEKDQDVIFGPPDPVNGRAIAEDFGRDGRVIQDRDGSGYRPV